MAATLLSLNGIASARVLNNSDLPVLRRFAQIGLIWLVPVVGAVLCLSFFATDTTLDKPSLDRTAFVDNADSGGLPYDAPPGSGLCGCAGSDGGGGDGGGD